DRHVARAAPTPAVRRPGRHHQSSAGWQCEQPLLGDLANPGPAAGRNEATMLRGEIATEPAAAPACTLSALLLEDAQLLSGPIDRPGHSVPEPDEAKNRRRGDVQTTLYKGDQLVPEEAQGRPRQVVKAPGQPSEPVGQ